VRPNDVSLTNAIDHLPNPAWIVYEPTLVLLPSRSSIPAGHQSLDRAADRNRGYEAASGRNEQTNDCPGILVWSRVSCIHTNIVPLSIGLTLLYCSLGPNDDYRQR